MKNGILLINLGTPKHWSYSAVYRYLSEFLSDKRVIDLPAPVRYLLLYTIILPFRLKRVSQAYHDIWHPEGSPLLVNSLKLKHKLQSQLGNEYQIALGMRYGHPSIREALDELSDCTQLTVLPLFPQYASAVTGSIIENILTLLAPKKKLPALTIIRDFYQEPGFINALTANIEPYLSSHDFVLFSYHGLPERHLIHQGCQTVCLGPCPTITSMNQSCYKAQCYMTTTRVANQLNLKTNQYAVAFQSRLGKTPWIKPYTDNVLHQLAQQGIKRLAITCPSFITDCLETLEEIGIRANNQWQTLGGTKLSLIPSLNDNDLWIEGMARLIKKDSTVHSN